MADPASDFLSNYQALAHQTWDAWSRQLQQSGTSTNPFQPLSGAATSANETLERTLDGLKSYLDWVQSAGARAPMPGADWQQQMQQWFGGARQPASQTFAHDTWERSLDGLKGYLHWLQSAAPGASVPGADWQQQMQQWLDGASQPFSQAFAGIDSAGAQGFAQHWQEWMQALQHAGGPGAIPLAPTPAFGMDREQQMQQQALALAMLASVQATAHYQALIQRANAQGMQRLQDKLAEHAEPGRQIDTLKGLYDLWVDASEEAYAEIALTDEFRTAYGEMVNTQMRARQLQQKYTEALCLKLGMPTRSEVSSLGERLQAVRREVRAAHGTPAAPVAGIDALRRELDALKRQVQAQADMMSKATQPVQQAKVAGAHQATSKPLAPESKPAVSEGKTAVAASRPQAKPRPAKKPQATTKTANGKRATAPRAVAGEPAAGARDAAAIPEPKAGAQAAGVRQAPAKAATRKAANTRKVRTAGSRRTPSPKRK